jgi:hypothetical protein
LIQLLNQLPNKLIFLIIIDVIKADDVSLQNAFESNGTKAEAAAKEKKSRKNY